MKIKHFALFLLAISFIAGCNSGQENKTNFKSEAYVGANIIDGTGNDCKENMTIIVKEGKIISIGKSNEIEIPIDVKIIETKGKWVMPGLIDMHAHVTILPVDSNLVIIEKYDQEASLEALKTMLAFGITTTRNPAAPTGDAIELRNLIASGKAIGPTIFTTGFALNRTKSFFGPFAVIVTEEEIREEIQNQAEQGVDFIKVYGSLKPEQIKIAIDEAHKHEKKVIGHLQNTTWTDAANLGIDFITHAAPWNSEYLSEAARINYRPTFIGRLYWLENVNYNDAPIQDMLTAMLENNVSVDPTLIAFRTKFWGDDKYYTQSKYLDLVPKLVAGIWNKTTFTSSWTPEDYSRAKKQWPKLLALTKLMFDKGILITAGSDFPNPWIIPGISLHQEFELLSEAGIPNNEIIKIATLNGAIALGIDDKTGSIELGKEADLIFLNSNPLDNIENTRSIDFVLNDGEKFIPTELNKYITMFKRY
ncbi:MAG: amidohydrolase family protein [Ignavibacteriales bacterium]|nr:MAG: amidohydrolase family protein [Ignavibacteriales bacterium]